MKYKKKIFALTLAMVVTGVYVSGCAGEVEQGNSEDSAVQTEDSTNSGSEDSSSADNSSEVIMTDTSQVTDSTNTVSEITEADLEFTARDLDVGYDETTATVISLSDSTVKITGEGAKEVDNKITITGEGTYIISGTLTDGQIVVDAGKSDKIQIVLNGVNIHCSNHAPIYIKQADKVFLTLVEGTENVVSDGAEYVLGEDDSNVDAAIFSKADLTINGSGKLTVKAAYKHGILSKDDLVITGGTYYVTAVGGGLYGKDCVKIKDGTFVLDTGNDGIKSDNTEDASRGFVYICDGDFTITSKKDAVSAETLLRIELGTFEIMTGEGSSVLSTVTNVREDFRQESSSASSEEEDSVSTKGLKAAGDIIINGGTFAIDSSDDTIHSNSNITISAGKFSLQSGDDGIHADSAVLISDGTVDIIKSYEGIEGSSVTINGGAIDVVSTDDGINASGGNDSSGGRMQDSFNTNSDSYIRIAGGMVNVNAAGDGIDSNGSVYIEGGTTYVSSSGQGDSALDYDGNAEITGGVFVGAGGTGMAQTFPDTSTQNSLFYNWDNQQNGNTTITMTDKNGTVLVSYTPKNNYQSVVVSTPEMKQGETYNLVSGENSVEVTLSSVSTTVGATSGGGRGGMKGGGRGEPGNRKNPDSETNTEANPNTETGVSNGI